jgi:hypothetical protein
LDCEHIGINEQKVAFTAQWQLARDPAAATACSLQHHHADCHAAMPVRLVSSHLSNFSPDFASQLTSMSTKRSNWREVAAPPSGLHQFMIFAHRDLEFRHVYFAYNFRTASLTVCSRSHLAWKLVKRNSHPGNSARSR